MVLRDHLGKIIFCACRHLANCDDSLESEVLAIWEGILLALQWSNISIDIESDCLFLEMEAYPGPLHHDDACGHLINKPKSSNKSYSSQNGAAKKIQKKENYMRTKSTGTMKINRISSLDSYPVM